MQDLQETKYPNYKEIKLKGLKRNQVHTGYEQCNLYLHHFLMQRSDTEFVDYRIPHADSTKASSNGETCINLPTCSIFGEQTSNFL